VAAFTRFYLIYLYFILLKSQKYIIFFYSFIIQITRLCCVELLV